MTYMHQDTILRAHVILLVEITIAKITWGIIGSCFGANDIPKNLHQYKIWIAKWLRGGKPIYTSGCAAVCWAIWKCKNKSCFDKKTSQEPMWDFTPCLFFSNVLGRSVQWGDTGEDPCWRSTVCWRVLTRCWRPTQGLRQDSNWKKGNKKWIVKPGRQ